MLHHGCPKHQHYKDLLKRTPPPPPHHHNRPNPTLKRGSSVSCRGIRGATSAGPQLPHLSTVHTPPFTQAFAMNIDMTLATSYKPVLVCISKVCALMVFHYASVPVLFVTERYALIVAMLYVDNWLSYEYIVNTNSCVVVLAGSLLVHELRDAGVQERLHGELAHTVVLSILVASNAMVLALGEYPSVFHTLLSSSRTQGSSVPNPTPTPNMSMSTTNTMDANNKLPRHHPHLHHPHTTCSIGSSNSTCSLVCVLSTCALLVVLSTCAMPVGAHDSLVNNIRVWSFTVLSLTWMYTVNYKELRYSIVAPFTPCLLRFSGILFLTPTPLAVGGIAFMGCCLAATHTLLCKQQNEMLCVPSAVMVEEPHNHQQPPQAHRSISNSGSTHHSGHHSGHHGGGHHGGGGGGTISNGVVTGVVRRDNAQGSVISYRAPVVLPGKAGTLGDGGGNGGGSSTAVGCKGSTAVGCKGSDNGGSDSTGIVDITDMAGIGMAGIGMAGVGMAGIGIIGSGDGVCGSNTDAGGGGCGILGGVDAEPSMDYDSLFKQAMNEQDI